MPRRSAALLLFIAPAAWAYDPLPPAAPAAELLFDAVAKQDTQRHIRALGSPKYAEREAAAKALAAEAERSLPAMNAAYQKSADPEVSRRLEVLIRKVEDDRLSLPRRVTLKATHAPIRSVLNALTRQTGYRFSGSVGDTENVKLNVDWKNITFWQALDELTDQTGVLAEPDDADPGSVNLSNSDATNPFASYSGGFRTLATNMSINRSVQLSGLPRRGGLQRPNEYMSMNLQVYAEPKSPIVMTLPVELITALDNTGTSLIVPEDVENSRMSYYSPYFYKSHSQYVGINFGRPGRGATEIKELKGKVIVRLYAGSRPEVECDGLLQAKKKKFLGRFTEIEIETATVSGTSCSVTLNARALNPDRADYSWSSSVYQRLEVVDDRGNIWPPTSCNSMTQNVGSCGLSASFGAPSSLKEPGQPKVLRLVEWLSTPQTVHFHFKNVPLP
jgi:hypothetical protein